MPAGSRPAGLLLKSLAKRVAEDVLPPLLVELRDFTVAVPGTVRLVTAVAQPREEITECAFY
jgi:hypothetical protein